MKNDITILKLVGTDDYENYLDECAEANDR